MPVMQQVGMIAWRAVDAAGDDDLQTGSGTDFIEAGEVHLLARHRERWRGDIEQDRKQQGPGDRRTEFSLAKHRAIVHAVYRKLPVQKMHVETTSVAFSMAKEADHADDSIGRRSRKWRASHHRIQ